MNVSRNYFIAKPFSTRELISSINTLSRDTEKIDEDKGITCFGDIIIYYKVFKVFIGGKEINLTLTEFSMLSFLL
ncbi:MAG: hypothetical protein HUJ51_06575 [Eggerthellaceae bacterium]|nr:hypothetical protein [Eggerthellaceae bacterium]